MYIGDTKKNETERIRICNEEATKIANTLINSWSKHYGTNPFMNDISGGSSMSSIGGWLCYEWTNFFYNAIGGLNFSAFKVTRAGGELLGDSYEHYWIEIKTCNNSSSKCMVQVDDGICNGNMVHSCGALPGKQWRRYTESRAIAGINAAMKMGK